MAERPTLSGAVAVLKAAGVVFATIFFLPGVLVRMACQLITANFSETAIVHRQLLTELGGEPECQSGSPNWTALLLATFLGPLAIGSVLLFPAVVRFDLLDVNPFLSVNPGMILTHQSSLAPFLEVRERFGFVGFLRLWFGVSCFYCSVPSAGILAGARAENVDRSPRSPVRLLLAPLLLTFRLLVAIDDVVRFVVPGVYLASGLLVLLLGWWLLAQLAQVTVGG
jgi:hypothetical protein